MSLIYVDPNKFITHHPIKSLYQDILINCLDEVRTYNSIDIVTILNRLLELLQLTDIQFVLEQSMKSDNTSDIIIGILSVDRVLGYYRIYDDPGRMIGTYYIESTNHAVVRDKDSMSDKEIEAIVTDIMKTIIWKM